MRSPLVVLVAFLVACGGSTDDPSTPVPVHKTTHAGAGGASAAGSAGASAHGGSSAGGAIDHAGSSAGGAIDQAGSSAGGSPPSGGASAGGASAITRVVGGLGQLMGAAIDGGTIYFATSTPAATPSTDTPGIYALATNGTTPTKLASDLTSFDIYALDKGVLALDASNVYWAAQYVKASSPHTFYGVGKDGSNQRTVLDDPMVGTKIFVGGGKLYFDYSGGIYACDPASCAPTKVIAYDEQDETHAQLGLSFANDDGLLFTTVDETQDQQPLTNHFAKLDGTGTIDLAMADQVYLGDADLFGGSAYGIDESATSTALYLLPITGAAAKAVGVPWPAPGDATNVSFFAADANGAYAVLKDTLYTLAPKASSATITGFTGFGSFPLLDATNVYWFAVDNAGSGVDYALYRMAR